MATELQRRSKPQRHHSRRRLKIGIGAALLLIVSLSLFPWHSLNDAVGGSDCSPSNPDAGKASHGGRVALVDGLSKLYPDPAFIDSINASARDAGRSFDYIPPQLSTINFFMNLPNRGYSVVILRSHGPVAGNVSALATSDPYSTSRRVGDQLDGRLVVMDVDGTPYFAITPEFVTKIMCGTFLGTLILAMACNGGFSALAHSFIEKGAKGFIGWNGEVTSSHTDIVFSLLVQLLLRGKTLTEATKTVMSELGPDPIYGSELSYFS
jgi:hypothetical protein